MEKEPLSKTLRRLEKYIYNLKAARELNTLGSRERELMIDLRNAIATARIAQTDAMHAEETRDLVRATELAVEQLEIVREKIIQASQYDLMTTVDVAQLSVLNEYIYEKLKKLLSE